MLLACMIFKYVTSGKENSISSIILLNLYARIGFEKYGIFVCLYVSHWFYSVYFIGGFYARRLRKRILVYSIVNWRLKYSIWRLAGIILYNPDIDRLMDNISAISPQVESIIDNNSINIIEFEEKLTRNNKIKLVKILVSGCCES